MTWQDELQQLDAELAAGRISAEDYRQRRDAILGRANSEQGGGPSGEFPAQPGRPGSPAGGFPQQPAQHQNPFPPAFNWGSAGQPAGSPQPDNVSGDAEGTQVVNINDAGTQAPPPHQGFGPPAQPHQQSPQQPPSPPQGWPAQQPNQGQQQPWPDQIAWPQPSSWNAWATNAADNNVGTPWGNSDMPPEHGDTSWMRQGPEVFETASKSGKGKAIGFSVAGVLLAGLAVAAVLFFTLGPDNASQPRAENRPANNTAQPTTTAPKLPAPPAEKPAPSDPSKVLIAKPEGPKHPYNGELTPAALKGAKSGLLAGPVRNFALENKMVNGWFRGTDGNKAPLGTSLIAIHMPDEASAAQLTERYREQQEQLATIDELSYRGVDVHSSGDTFRGSYTSHGWMIVVEVRATDAPDEQARTLFQELLDKQLARTPPTVRD